MMRDLPPLGARTLMLGLAGLFVSGCAEVRGAEDPVDWYDPGDERDVVEAVAFTDQPYDTPVDPSTGVGALLDAVYPVSAYKTAFSADDQYSTPDCESVVDRDLPWEIEGIVTIHPRFYYKTQGCDGDEKYYGSFFIQDKTGGIFVLGDTKVAHFDVGDRIRMSVRGARTSFGLNMVYAHDVLEITRGPEPVFYETPTVRFGAAHIGRVQRVTGVVRNEMSTFGEFQIQADNGVVYDIQIDSELSRRGLSYDIGTRIQVTGPVLYSYSVHSIVVMRVGQVSVLD